MTPRPTCWARPRVARNEGQIPSSARPRRGDRRLTGAAFTLVEVLIVVIVLGILAAVVIPRFTQAGTDPRLSHLTRDLQAVRAQLERYKVQHLGLYPTLDDFSEQLTGTTDINGNVAGTDFGPYLHRVPAHPFTGQTTVGSGGYGSSTWYYNPGSGEFRSNDTAGHAAY